MTRDAASSRETGSAAGPPPRLARPSTSHHRRQPGIGAAACLDRIGLDLELALEHLRGAALDVSASP
jgi:hypothetical protein